MCDCKVCQRSREFQLRLAAVPEEHRAFFEGLMSDLEHTELERDHMTAVLDGSWPNSAEVLEAFRLKREARLAATAP